jgi:hypothetical protein
MDSTVKVAPRKRLVSGWRQTARLAADAGRRKRKPVAVQAPAAAKGK